MVGKEDRRGSEARADQRYCERGGFAQAQSANCCEGVEGICNGWVNGKGREEVGTGRGGDETRRRHACGGSKNGTKASDSRPGGEGGLRAGRLYGQEH